MSDRTVWEDVFWPVEKLFKGETVFCLASGPSLTQEVCEKVCGHRTIVINSSYTLAPWADVLFFTDNGWFEKHETIVKAWPGRVITVSRAAKRQLPDIVKRVKSARPLRGFPSLESGEVRQGRSSGHTAIGLAVAMGAKRVVMLGYDMKTVGDREHHHTEYLSLGRPRNMEIYAKEFVPAFQGWNEDARKIGVEVLNATEGSAVKEFPFVNLDHFLRVAA